MADTEREAFEKAINAQRFFPRELDFSRGTSPGGRDEYVNSHIESNWNGWRLRAALASRHAEVDDWIKLSEQEPEVGETVLVFSEIWGSSRVLRFRVQPWKSFLDADQGRWFWNLETMLWKRFSAPSHTTNKEK